MPDKLTFYYRRCTGRFIKNPLLGWNICIVPKKNEENAGSDIKEKYLTLVAN